MNTFSSSQKHRAPKRTHTAPAAPPRRQSESAEAPSEGLRPLVLGALFALPFTAIIGLILLLVTAAIALSVPDPDAMITPLSMAVLGVTSLLCGLIAARRNPAAPLLTALCGGTLFTLLLWVLTFLVDRTDPTLTLGTSGWGRFALHAAVVALSTAGGLLGSRRPTPRRKHTARKR